MKDLDVTVDRDLNVWRQHLKSILLVLLSRAECSVTAQDSISTWCEGPALYIHNLEILADYCNEFLSGSSEAPLKCLQLEQNAVVHNFLAKENYSRRFCSATPPIVASIYRGVGVRN